MGTLAPRWSPAPALDLDALDGDTPPPEVNTVLLWRILKQERAAHQALRETWRAHMLAHESDPDALRLKNLRIGLSELVDACRSTLDPPPVVEAALRVADQALSYERRNGGEA